MLGLQLLAKGEQGLNETVKLDVRNFSLLPPDTGIEYIQCIYFVFLTEGMYLDWPLHTSIYVPVVCVHKLQDFSLYSLFYNVCPSGARRKLH
jgi:hypothetical protein